MTHLGCELLISITSAGQIVPAGPLPYFVLIERALRDEGTSYHYLAPARYSAMRPDLLGCLEGAFAGAAVRVLSGTTWTTDAPFRETAEAIQSARSEGILGVEMEAAALYAFAQARDKQVVCFAHITNQMAVAEGEFEKGIDGGSHDTLKFIDLTASRWLGRSHADRETGIVTPASSSIRLGLRANWPQFALLVLISGRSLSFPAPLWQA